MKEIKTQIFLGDCENILKGFEDNCIDLIFPSPPYADRRKHTYGGIKPEKYVEWFLPKSEQFLRVLKPSGTFILNIEGKGRKWRKAYLCFRINIGVKKTRLVMDRRIYLA